MSETLPCGHRFIGGSRCHGTPDWHDGAAGKHPYQPTDRRSGQERRRAARQPTVDVEALSKALRELSEAASPDWTLAERGVAVRVVRERSDRGAQIGNFICEEDAELAVVAVAYVRAALAAQETKR